MLVALHGAENLRGLSIATAEVSVVPDPVWLALLGALAVLLVVDLAVVRARGGEMSLRPAAVASLVWVAIALAFFGVLLRAGDGGTPARSSPATWSRSRCRWTTSSVLPASRPPPSRSRVAEHGLLPNATDCWPRWLWRAVFGSWAPPPS